MKKNTHPNYGPVTFQDRTTGETFTTRSTLGQEGLEARKITVDVSSYSHPVWTGRQRSGPSEGRVAAFERRYGKKTDESTDSR